MQTDTPSSNPGRNPDPNPGRRRQWLLRLVAVVGLGGLAYGAWWMSSARFHEHTDNAYVGGNLVQVTPQLAGTVLSINADDTDFVEAGAPLVQLDPADAQVALAQAEAALADAVRQVRRLGASRDGAEALVEQRSAQLRQAQDDLQRRQRVSDSGALADEELAHARAAVQVAEAALREARQAQSASQALAGRLPVAEHPQVLQAAARVREASLALRRTTLPAPVSGYVARRSVQVGQRIAAGAPLMAIVPLDSLWVDANFKESQLARMRIGQPVQLTADVYGRDVVFHGQVSGFGAGTGGVFSLLPAQNATGNWIKVVQRVPVRVSLDPVELREHPLRVGLSMLADVDLHDSSGPVLGTARRSEPAFETRAFGQQDGEVEARISRIIAANLGGERS